MKLIDMEKVLSELCLSHKDIIYIDKNETAERIRKMPSIDIVRCRECIHYGRDSERNTYGCNLHSIGMTPSDFCSYGEREGE